MVQYKDMPPAAWRGRIAEEIILGRDKVTTGAGSDLPKRSGHRPRHDYAPGMGDKLRDQVFKVDEGMMLRPPNARARLLQKKPLFTIDKV